MTAYNRMPTTDTCKSNIVCHFYLLSRIKKKYLNKDRRICKGTERRNGWIKCPSLVQMCRSRRGEGGPEITDEEDIFNEGNAVPF